MDVFSACILSFLVVFILLGFLSVLIRMINGLFPACAAEDDSAVVAAIHAAVAASLPGARVTRIEEIKK